MGGASRTDGVGIACEWGDAPCARGCIAAELVDASVRLDDDKVGCELGDGDDVSAVTVADVDPAAARFVVGVALPARRVADRAVTQSVAACLGGAQSAAAEEDQIGDRGGVDLCDRAAVIVRLETVARCDIELVLELHARRQPRARERADQSRCTLADDGVDAEVIEKDEQHVRIDVVVERTDGGGEGVHGRQTTARGKCQTACLIEKVGAVDHLALGKTVGTVGSIDAARKRRETDTRPLVSRAPSHGALSVRLSAARMAAISSALAAASICALTVSYQAYASS